MYNNNMNVALCLSGQPRDLKIGIDSIKNNIILPNQNSCNFDVFCHYWFNENLIGQPFDSAQQSQNYKMGMWDQNTHEYINNLSPRDSFYESPNSDVWDQTQKQITEYESLARSRDIKWVQA